MKTIQQKNSQKKIIKNKKKEKRLIKIQHLFQCLPSCQ